MKTLLSDLKPSKNEYYVKRLTNNRVTFSMQTLIKVTIATEEEAAGTMVVVEKTEDEDEDEEGVTIARKVKEREITRRSSVTIVRRKVTLLMYLPRRKKIKSSTKLKQKMQMLLSICMKLDSLMKRKCCQKHLNRARKKMECGT